MSEPTVVDVHSHATPDAFVDQVRRMGSKYGFELSELADGDRVVITTPDREEIRVGPTRRYESVRQQDMAAAGIDLRLQSVGPGLMSYGVGETQAEWVTRTLNDAQGVDMLAWPEHVHAMATVALQFPLMAAKELERVHAEFGMRCVQIATNVNGENLDEPQFTPFWEAAHGLGMLVFVHPRYLVGEHRMSRYYLSNLIGNPLDTTIAAASLVFGGVFDRFPDLKVVLAHGGGCAPWLRYRWRFAHETRAEPHQRGADRPFDDYFSLFYFDSLLHDRGDAPGLRYLIDTVGADHILHGTDYPANMGDWRQVDLIKTLPDVSYDEKALILGGNALRLIAGA